MGRIQRCFLCEAPVYAHAHVLAHFCLGVLPAKSTCTFYLQIPNAHSSCTFNMFYMQMLGAQSASMFCMRFMLVLAAYIHLHLLDMLFTDAFVDM